MITRIDVHLQSGDISIYWLQLLLYISAVSVVIVIIAICDMPRQEFSLCIFTIHICNFSNFVALCTDDTVTPVSCDKRFRDFLGVCSNLSPISSNVRTWRWRLTFLFFTEPVSLNLLACLLIVLGYRHRSSWKLYSKFASCLSTRLFAFHIPVCIVNIHMFTQWEFLSRHVTNRNNHNHYTYSIMSNNNHN